MKLWQYVAKIINDIEEFQSSEAHPFDPNGNFPLPTLLYVGEIGSLITNENIERSIVDFADALANGNKSISNLYKREEWVSLVRDEFGKTLNTLNLSEDRYSVSKSIVCEIKSSINIKPKEIEFSFPVTVFLNESVRGFKIGSIKIESKYEWLDSIYREKKLSKISKRRIIKFWEGSKLKKRKSSIDASFEESVIRTINLPYVITVKTENLARNIAEDRAKMAARLALTSISLIWNRPSKILDGMNLDIDRVSRQLKIMTFKEGFKTVPGSYLSHMPYGINMKPDEWEEELACGSDYFSACGDVIDYYLYNKSIRPNINHKLLQSLMWFHEGCREQMDLISVVKFAASMDVLGGGQGEKNIKELISARLGLLPDMPIRPGGPKMSETVNQIYKSARSRSLHGNNDKLSDDWSVCRRQAEALSRHCLVACFDWYSKNPRSDNVEMLRA